ncbi:hypothetical protein F2Q68_00045224 [Brassica cretica]|uniref:Uncharacterized protein n=1 Tax=Brassica cretica TaxID=69181 RepID=A0A8S9LLK3_BRACR|nr:hypothetical protein F2Q68_00045224 [Brassica cretica]
MIHLTYLASFIYRPLELEKFEHLYERLVRSIKALPSSTIEAHRSTLLSDAEGARARRRRDSPLHLCVTAVSPSIFIVCVFACCLASVSLCAFSVTTHLARRLIVISSARIRVAVSPLRAWVRAGSLQSVSKLTGYVRLFVTMATPSLIRAKSLPPPSDLSLTSPNLVSCRRASPTGIFRRRDRPVTTATTTPCALCLCFSPVLILKPGSPSVTPSQPPQDSKYSVLSPFSTRLTGLTTTAPSDDASCSDGALGAIICQRKTLILPAPPSLLPFGSGRRMCPGMGMGLALVHLTLINLLYRFDWNLPEGMKAGDVDLEESYGLVCPKKVPLELIPVLTQWT